MSTDEIKAIIDFAEAFYTGDEPLSLSSFRLQLIGKILELNDIGLVELADLFRNLRSREQ